MDKTLDLYLTPLALRGTVNVSWNTVFINDDDRMLTGYYIFYKVAYEENVTYLDGRDACHDDWSRKYVENKVSDGFITQIIEDLEPATKYAFYVQTDTVVDAAIGARSNISYTTTLPYNPSKPPNVKVTDKTDRSMTVMWSTPMSPNGEIEQYIVTVKHLPYLDDSAPSSYENAMRPPKLPIEEVSGAALVFLILALLFQCMKIYEVCVECGGPQHRVPPHQVAGGGGGRSRGAAGGAAGGECCACPESRREERQQEIDFEDELYGLVYNDHPFPFSFSSIQQQTEAEHQRDRRRRRTEPADPLLNTSDLDPAIYQDLINISNSSPLAKEPLNPPGDCEFVEDSPYCSDPSQCLPHGAARCWRDATRLLRGEGGAIVKNTSELSLTITGLHHFTIYEIKVVACHRPTTDCPQGSNMKECVLCSLNPSLLRTPRTPKCISEKEFVERNMTFHLNMSQLLPGRYNLSVETYTRPDSPSNKSLEAVIFVVEGGPDTPLHLKLLAVALLVGVVLVVVLALVTRVCTKPDEKIVTTLNPIYAQESGLPAWIQHVYDIIGGQDIIDSSDLHVEEGPPLGEGKFGLVLNGRLRLEAKNIPVAVKQVTDFQAREDILQEAKLMLKLNCYHLVRAYGVVPRATHILLVMEYMNCGDLLRYIRSRKPPDDDILSVITIDHVCAMAVQIADGMAYLASRKIVHRDLAARNCLINDNMNIKISDFGMARLTDNDYYRIRESKYFPVRWLPPEYHLKFTSQSDVWSYGIVLWEILSGGARPYEHLTNDNDVLQQVRRGYTLETHIPKGTPSFLAKILISCWRYKGSTRPYFPQLVAALLPSTSPCFIQHFRMVSFYHTADGQEYKRQLETQQDVDEDSDITSPLNESSPLPFCHPIRQDGPPLPPRPLTGTRWRPSFRFRGATVPRYTQQPTHLSVTDLESLTLSQQVLPSNREGDATSPSRNVTSTLVDLTTSKSQEESVRENVKTSPFHSSETDVVAMNTHTLKALHTPLAATTANPSPSLLVSLPFFIHFSLIPCSKSQKFSH
ncbi:putative insulin receptor, partial [Penaeus vannamei]